MLSVLTSDKLMNEGVRFLNKFTGWLQPGNVNVIQLFNSQYNPALGSRNCKKKRLKEQVTKF